MTTADKPGNSKSQLIVLAVALVVTVSAAIGMWVQHASIKKDYNQACEMLASQNPDFTVVEPWIKEYLRYFPSDAAAHHRLGLTLRNLNKMEDAIVSYQKAISLDSTQAGTYNNLGVLYQLSSRNDEASWAYRKSLHFDSSRNKAGFNLGLLLQNTGNHPEAIYYLSRALAQNSQSARAAFAIGISHIYTGDLAAARKQFTTAIDINPYYADAYMNRGIICEKLGDLEAAEQDLLKATELLPQVELNYHNLAIFYLKQGEYLKARDSIKAALTKLPEGGGKIILVDRAEIALMKEEYKEALSDLEKALVLDPQYLPALIKTGFANMHLKKYRLAVEAYKKAEQLAPDNAEILENLYRIYRSLGKVKESDHYLDLFQRAPKGKLDHKRTKPQGSSYHL